MGEERLKPLSVRHYCLSFNHFKYRRNNGDFVVIDRFNFTGIRNIRLGQLVWKTIVRWLVDRSWI